MPDTLTPAKASDTKEEIIERAPEPVADDPVQQDAPDPAPAPQAGAEGDEPPPAPPAKVSRNERMKAIAEKLRSQRAGENAPEFTGDYSDPSQTAGNIAAPKSAEAPAEPAEPAGDEPAPAPKDAEPAKPAAKVYRLKVDGEEIDRDIEEVARLSEMTVEEVARDPGRAVRYAQKELASSRRLDKANGILRGAHQRPADARGTTGEAPHEPTRANADLAPEPSADARNQGVDEFATLVEEIQLGDPKEAAGKLQSAITKAVRQATPEAIFHQRMQDDFNDSMQTLSKFKDQHQDLATDEAAEAVMERMIYGAYREDLKAIGVTEDRIPKSTNELADWHRAYRVNGQKVRTTEKLLQDVHDGFVKWRGGTTPGQGNNTSTNPAPRQNARVNVDRTQRRQAIPTQPTRNSAAPQQSASPQPRTRSQTITLMRKSRGQVTA